MSKTQEIETLLKQFKNVLQHLMTAQQRKYLDKLTTIYKQLSKTSKELQIQDVSSFFSSLKIQLYTLKKDVLNNKKKKMSDYEAFLFKYQLYQKNKQLFIHIPKKQLMQKLNLPQRSITWNPSNNNESKLLNQLRSLTFCPLGHQINSIITFSSQILMANSYCKKSFSPSVLNKLLNQIANQYQIVSYHNFTHAFSVQLMFFQIIENEEKLRKIFSEFEIAISYVAALAHDMGHYGTNSDFQVKRKSQIAKLYSNQSVLQNMHVAKFWRMLRKHPQIDIISQIKDPVQKERSKRLIIRLILGTDVSKHFEGLNKLKHKTRLKFTTLTSIKINSS